MTSYQQKHRNYYQNHREDILEKEREKKRWIQYYQANKEAIKQRRIMRQQGVAPANDMNTIYAFINLENPVVANEETT